MTLMKALLEGTYAIQPIADKIFNDIIKPYLIQAKSDNMMIPKTVNITSYLQDIILDKIDKLDWPIMLTIKMNFGKNHHVNYVLANNEISGKKRINIVMTYLRKDVNEKNITWLKKHIMSEFTHELVHAIDFERSGEKVYSFGHETKQKKLNWYEYSKDPFEINSHVHQIKIVIAKKRTEWNSIKTTSRLQKFLHDNLESIEAILIQLNKGQIDNYFKRLIKRLGREGMLPPNLTGKVMSPTDK